MRSQSHVNAVQVDTLPLYPNHEPSRSCCCVGAISSLQEQASTAAPMAMVQVDARICEPAGLAADAMPSQPQALRVHKPEEEIAMGEPAECHGQVNECIAAQLTVLSLLRPVETGPACWFCNHLPRRRSAG